MMTLTIDPHAPPSAAILRFPRRRGRPRKLNPRHDTGTPELVMKRLKGETAETLDLCLERGIITPQQHWCGIHLRWLYTLRYGAPGVRAVDPTHLGGIETKIDDPDWRASREQEYADALKKLSARGCLVLIMDICVYNERPGFLNVPRLAAKSRRKMETEISKMCEGLDILVKHWER